MAAAGNIFPAESMVFLHISMEFHPVLVSFAAQTNGETIEPIKGAYFRTINIEIIYIWQVS